MKPFLAGSVAVVLAGLACSSPAEPIERSVFVIRVVEETFRIQLDDPGAIAQARALMHSGNQTVVIGELASGHGGHNTGFSWHLRPATIEFADAAIELCDGLPSFVEEELAYFLDVVGSYCPWSSRVIAEEH